MTILWLCLFIGFSMALLARYFAYVPSIGALTIRPNRFLVFLTIAVLALVSGLRNNIGDTYFYMHSYTITDFRMGFEFEGDFGFNLYQLLLQQVSKDPQILIFVTSVITILLIGLVLHKYSRMFELSVYVFITGGMYITSMNGIRQFLASAIIFAASKYLFEGHWKKYFLLVLLASTIHTSALILLPIYFIVRRKAWTRGTLLGLLLAVFIVLGFNEFSALLFNVIQDTQYGVYQSFQEGGASVIRVVVYAIPLVVAFLGRAKLRKLNPNSDYIVNMAMLGLIFLIISTQNWIFARFSIYFGLYQVLLISWIVKLFREQDQKLIYYGILLFFFLLFYFESVIALGIKYGSDYLAL
jgi:transmembrane protein EpsG